MPLPSPLDHGEEFISNRFLPDIIFPENLVVELYEKCTEIFRALGTSVFVQLGTSFNVDDSSDVHFLKKATVEFRLLVEPYISAWMQKHNLKPFVAKKNGLPEFWVRMHEKHHSTPLHCDLDTNGYRDAIGPNGCLYTLWVPLQQVSLKTGGVYIKRPSSSSSSQSQRANIKSAPRCRQMSPGQCLLFDGATLHGSARSSVQRFSMDFRFVPINADPLPTAEGPFVEFRSLQQYRREVLAREWKEAQQNSRTKAAEKTEKA